jgi:hypothetical protein
MPWLVTIQRIVCQPLELVGTGQSGVRTVIWRTGNVIPVLYG